ncbi:MAG: hypothetical protein M1814_002407 [Vezdaea aestivalis]|nr:MAG: hypothetical protein M1814_002407 [Vezdaea aestivalis]
MPQPALDPALPTPMRLANVDGRIVLQTAHDAAATDRSSASLFAGRESKAAAQLTDLKNKLSTASDEVFWPLLVETLADITDSQMAFVSKRILVDDENTAVELPPIGQPGSCLAGVVFCFNNDNEAKHTVRDIRYKAYDCPCAYMAHNQVVIIPEKWNELITKNPNKLDQEYEAYLGVPLFAEGKCFAHFGLCYTVAGAARRRLDWTFIEMLFHSLEDVVTNRLVRGQGLSNKPPTEARFIPPTKVIPHEAVSMSQSLKPFARSLSHELRTPMQGVVGMLDVMYATVQEAAEGHPIEPLSGVFKSLKDNIEVVQDSSRRAVEAADNVVHAYDLNMEIPDTPLARDLDTVESSTTGPVQPAKFEIYGQVPTKPKPKRRRSPSVSGGAKPPTKYRIIDDRAGLSPNQRSMSPRRKGLRQAVKECHDLFDSSQVNTTVDRRDSAVSISPREQSFPIQASDGESAPQPGLRNTRLRELLQYIINESLRVGGRPDSAVAIDTELGERIEVRTKKSSGEKVLQNIEWSVDPAVPEHLMIDERDLGKMISCVLLNAIKFTETGDVTLSATLSPKNKYIVINIKDTGPGIPANFLPNLFKPFSREDESITRQKDGLGLGLLVAKGLIRKLGGDLACIRSETSGPNHGSEFEIRFPSNPSDTSSFPGTPIFRSPTPSATHLPLPDPTSIPRSEARFFNSARSITSSSPSPPPPSTRLLSPLRSPLRASSPNPTPPPHRRNSYKKTTFDRNLASKHPLNVLVVEDNKLNRRLLVNMLSKLGYTSVIEAHDGLEAVRQMERPRSDAAAVDLVLMDLWMPNMDGYEATRRILAMDRAGRSAIRVLAVSADVTSEALDLASRVGMSGFMTKPYKLMDLEKLILEYVEQRHAEEAAARALAEVQVPPPASVQVSLCGW